MPNRTQLVLICKALEQCLREAGFVFFDIQFDEPAQTLRIDLKRSAGRGSAIPQPKRLSMHAFSGMFCETCTNLE